MAPAADAGGLERLGRMNELLYSTVEYHYMGQSTRPIGRHSMMFWYQALAIRKTQLSIASALPDHDIPRYTVLMTACRHEDIFYVLFHQLCCLWSSDKAILYDILDTLATPDAVDFTFSEAQRILNIIDLFPADLQWFANFPWPVEVISATLPGTVVSVQITGFIKEFSARWESLLDHAEAEYRPITSPVLRSRLHCASPILRYILFVASSLQIGIVTGPGAIALDKNFHQDEDEGCGNIGETLRQALAYSISPFHYGKLSKEVNTIFSKGLKLNIAEHLI